jgi:adenosylmethionine-8-amino-7-oxononanoate aminotransferase
MFTSGGSEANELSLRICRRYYLARSEPERWKMITLDQSYHGATVGALSMTGRADLREDYAPYMLAFPKVAPPVSFRGPFSGLPDEEFAEQASAAVAGAIEAADPTTVAAVVAEPISASTGMAVPPPGYWRRIREICDDYGILLIADEIITGMGRTGSFLALEQEGVTADLTNLGKGLGAGYVPLGATLVREEVAETIGEEKRRMGEVHTYGGSPLSCAVGLGVLDAFEHEDLIRGTVQRGARLRALLEEKLGDLPCVGDIRGRGLFQAVEYVEAREGRAPFPESSNVAGRLGTALWEKGVIMGCLRFKSPLVADCTLIVPPLVVSEAQLEHAAEMLRQTIIETILTERM